MPIYEYQCSECEEKFAARQSIDEDDSRLKCPRCSGSKMLKNL